MFVFLIFFLRYFFSPCFLTFLSKNNFSKILHFLFFWFFWFFVFLIFLCFLTYCLVFQRLFAFFGFFLNFYFFEKSHFLFLKDFYFFYFFEKIFFGVFVSDKVKCSLFMYKCLVCFIYFFRWYYAAKNLSFYCYISFSCWV